MEAPGEGRQCLGHEGGGTTRQRQCLGGNTQQRQWHCHERGDNTRQRQCLTGTPKVAPRPRCAACPQQSIAAFEQQWHSGHDNNDVALVRPLRCGEEIVATNTICLTTAFVHTMTMSDHDTDRSSAHRQQLLAARVVSCVAGVPSLPEPNTHHLLHALFANSDCNAVVSERRSRECWRMKSMSVSLKAERERERERERENVLAD